MATPTGPEWAATREKVHHLAVDILIAHLIMRTNRILTLLGDPDATTEATTKAVKEFAATVALKGVDPAISDVMSQMLGEALDDALALARPTPGPAGPNT